MIHAQACAGKYTNDLFRKRTRKTLDQLWAEYAKAKKAPDGGRTFRLANARSSLALAAHGPEGKAEVTLMALSRNKEQVWRLEKVKDDFVIVNVATKMVLEVPEGSREKVRAHRRGPPRRGEPAVAGGGRRTLLAPVEAERPVRQRLRRAAGRRSTGHPVAETHQGRCGRSAVVDPGGGLKRDQGGKLVSERGNFRFEFIFPSEK